MDLSATKLKTFEKWKQEIAKDDSLLRAYIIPAEIHQRALDNSLQAVARTSAAIDMNQILAKARLPFSDPRLSYGTEYTTLYVAKNMFDLNRNTVLWMLDGDVGQRLRRIKCETGVVDDLVMAFEEQEFIHKMPTLSENQCRLFYKRVEEWYQYQVMTGVLE
jgi:hypothetical protein